MLNGLRILTVLLLAGSLAACETVDDDGYYHEDNTGAVILGTAAVIGGALVLGNALDRQENRRYRRYNRYDDGPHYGGGYGGYGGGYRQHRCYPGYC